MKFINIALILWVFPFSIYSMIHQGNRDDQINLEVLENSIRELDVKETKATIYKIQRDRILNPNHDGRLTQAEIERLQSLTDRAEGNTQYRDKSLVMFKLFSFIGIIAGAKLLLNKYFWNNKKPEVLQNLEDKKQKPKKIVNKVFALSSFMSASSFAFYKYRQNLTDRATWIRRMIHRSGDNELILNLNYRR